MMISLSYLSYLLFKAAVTFVLFNAFINNFLLFLQIIKCFFFIIHFTDDFLFLPFSKNFLNVFT